MFAEAEAAYPEGGGYPKYVKEEVSEFLRCGILSRGFARFACRACGHERLVAYSCKSRGLCPSCVAKRSVLTALHLIDHVLPVCPYRQWTLSLPYAIRFRLIRDEALLSRVVTTFVRTVFGWQKRQAKAYGLTDVHSGSITFVQRYNSLLQICPHPHSWVPDGVLIAHKDGTLSFAPLPAPSETDVARLCARVARRVMQCLGEDEDAEPTFEEDDAAVAQVQVEALHPPVRQRTFFDEPPGPPPKRAPLSAVCGGFSLHAGLAVAAEDRKTLCRLLQYGSRPPFAQKRLSLLPDGTVRLKLRKPTPSGQADIRLSAERFLKRLFAILPPPRWHLTRYHGIFSSHAKLRPQLKALLPKPPPPVSDRVDADADASARGRTTELPEPFAADVLRAVVADLPR